MAVTVWRNGSIWIDQTRRTTSIAVKAGKVVAHGDQVDDYINSATAIHDLSGNSLLPAFRDGHAHPLNGGIEQLFAPVNTATSLANLLQKVGEYAKANPDLEIIRGEGYDPSFAENGNFDAHWLDEVVPDRPVILRALDYHTAWLNSAALELAEITSTTPEPNLGEIVRRPDNSPLGTLREWGAWELAYRKLPALTAEQGLAAAQFATDYFAACGVTWLQDAWVADVEYEIWLAAAKAGILKQRVNFAWLANPLENWKAQLPIWVERKKFLTNNFENQLSGNSVKIFTDGILEGGTAALIEKYCDCPSTGIANWNSAQLTEVIDLVIENGFQPHVHAIGDAGIRETLNALAQAKLKHGSTNNAVIAHSQLIHPDDKPRFAELGVIANFEPLWAQLSEEQLELTIPRIGHSRAALQYPIASMFDLGTTVSFGSDWPVTSGKPLDGISVALTRTTPEGLPDGGWVPTEKISLAQAVHAYTYGVAAQAGELSQFGTLEIGCAADLVTFDCDLTQVLPLDLAKVQVTGTWLGGNQVFSS